MAEDCVTVETVPSASVTSSTGTAPAGVPALNFLTQSAPYSHIQSISQRKHPVEIELWPTGVTSIRSSSNGISAMVSASRAGSARPPGPPKYVSFRRTGGGMLGPLACGGTIGNCHRAIAAPASVVR